MWGPAVCWQVRSALDFGAQLASASARPDIANQRPHDGNYGHDHKNGEGHEYTYRIFHLKFAVYSVEAVKAADGRSQRRHILLRHLKDVFVRMILGFPGKYVPGRVHFNMAAQDET